MPDYDELIHISATLEKQSLKIEPSRRKTPKDYVALAVTTFGVGYLPLAPGTWGSMVGVAIYLMFGSFKEYVFTGFGGRGWNEAQIAAWIHAGNLFLFLLFCLLGIWAASRATKLFKNKDPQQAVVDEVIGQLITYLFIPFGVHWFFVAAGFLLFRLFDIWKPYPIDSLQNLPTGIGVCADDILAGVYAGASLSALYAVWLTWFI
jgi:phosphatidylglycerophosphatase A